MARTGWLDSCVVLWCILVVDFAEAADEVCYGGGSIAGAVLGTLFVILALLGLAYLFYRYYWKNKKDKHLVLATDPENVKDEFAFDNPGFKSSEGAWLRSQAPPTLAGGKAGGVAALPPSRPDFKDDTFLENVRGRSAVPLWSRDFTGLGFEVTGGMRDGIHVSSVLRGGPAAESGRIHPGDRINSVTISFRHMVYEDAVAILSYASPYELRLEVEEGPASGANVVTDVMRSPLAHPKMMRAASHADVSDLEKVTRHHPTRPHSSPNSTLESSAHKNTSASSAIKKIITDKIHTSSTLERLKHHQHAPKERKDGHMTTLERENEKNAKNKHHIETSPRTDKKSRITEVDGAQVAKPERNKNRNSGEMIVSPEFKGNLNQRISSPPDVVIIKDGGDRYSAKVEKVEVQKRESDAGKKGMKFGIRVLPPNVPDDGTVIASKNSKYDALKSGTENGNIVAEIRSIDEVDKNFANNISVNTDVEAQKIKPTAPVVAKRREKPLAPVPNARVLPPNNVASPAHIEIKMETISPERKTMEYENVSFDRSDDLNSSGIKRDAQGIPQEIPQHMMEAAMFARSNRKPSSEAPVVEKQKPEVPPKRELTKIEIKNEKESAASKLLAANKKSKGKAPSPPDASNSSDTESSNVTQDTVISVDIKLPNTGMNFTDNFNDHSMSDMQTFMDGERNHSTSLHESNRSDDMILSKINTSTSKVEKVVKRMRPEIPTQKPSGLSQIDIQDDIDTYELKPYQKKEANDSLNNYFEDSRSIISSNLEGNSVISLSQDSFVSNTNSELDKLANASTTIELNSSDITIHSSPTNESDKEMQDMDDNERKAASLGDLSRLEPADKSNRKPSQGTLERAQSLDIASEEAKITANEKHNIPKKRKSNSVFDGSYYNDNPEDTPLDSNENVSQLLVHSKEPRLSLNISNISMEGLNTFQRNRLKKSSEWGNLEDAILMKKNLTGSSHSGSSEIATSVENLNQTESVSGRNQISKALEDENAKLNDEINKLKQVSNEVVGEAIEKAILKTNEVNDRIQSHVLENEIIKPQKEVSKVTPDITASGSSVEIQKMNIVKPDVQIRNKPLHVETYDTRPNFEIGTYVSGPNNKYKTDNTPVSSSRLSPKLEDKLTMIYDTNIPDDIKVSRHTLVSSLERPKSDLMKKLLAQSPALSAGIEKSAQPSVSQTDLEKNEQIESGVTPIEVNSAELGKDVASRDICNDKNIDAKSNATSFTLLNQPDIVNLKIKQNRSETLIESNDPSKAEADFISNINIIGGPSKNEGSKINFHFDNSFPPTSPEKVQGRSFFSTNDNIVTISTDGSQPSSIITIEGEQSGLQNVVENFRNSIEVNSSFDDSKDDTLKKKDQNETEQSLYNEIITELRKGTTTEANEELPVVSTTSSSTYLVEGSERNAAGMTPYVIDTQTINLPGQKTVTVSVTEDEHGNKIITQNVEETVTRLYTVTSAPIEVEQYTFGIIKNPTAADIQRIEDSDFSENIDAKIISEIEHQNPNIKFMSTDPTYTNTETMTINANMTEEETRLLLEKFRSNPQIMMGNKHDTPGITIKETKMVVEESRNEFDGHPIIKMTQASYKFRDEDDMRNQPIKIVKMIESDGKVRLEDAEELNQQVTSEAVHRMVDKINRSNGEPTRIGDNIFTKSETFIRETQFESPVVNRMEIKSTETPVKDYITEIEVLTPRTEKISKQKSDVGQSNERTSEKITTYNFQPSLFNEIDISFMGDFLNNERRFSEKEKLDSEKYERRKSYSPDMVQNGKDSNSRRQSNEDQKQKRHSDFDLPRNTHIKFRTATYEPQTTSPNKLTSSEKRLSQIEILKSNFEKGSLESLSNSTHGKPSVSTKPSSIPVKLPDKPISPHKTSTVSPSKIPVLHSQSPKAVSTESLSSYHSKLPTTATGNITITSIKSSSRNPSGK